MDQSNRYNINVSGISICHVIGGCLQQLQDRFGFVTLYNFIYNFIFFYEIFLILNIKKLFFFIHFVTIDFKLWKWITS